MKKPNIFKLALLSFMMFSSYGARSQIKISSDAFFNINADCYVLTNNDVIINSGGLLSLRGCATIGGTLTNSAGTSGLVVHSDASGTGSLIESSGVSATVERFITQDIYHYITPPVTGQNISLLQSGTAHTDFDLFWYDENHAGGQGPLWIDASGQAGNLAVGQGYAYTYMPESRTLGFTGTTNQGTLSVPVTYTYNSEVSSNEWYFGWNLVGNPYPSRINAETFIDDADNSDIYGTLYFWDEGAVYSNGENDYGSLNKTGSTSGGGGKTPNGIIGVGQAFMVHYGSGTGQTSSTVSFKNNMRVHDEAVFFKNSDPWRFMISLENEAGSYNETLIGFVPEASNGFDNKYDGAKLKGNPNIALYTKLVQEDGLDYAIQALPMQLEDGVLVKLGMNAIQTGMHTLKVQRIENFNDTVSIYLEDSYLNKFTNLRSQPEYHFAVENAGVTDERFILHFNGYGVGTEEISTPKNNYHIYAYYGDIIIEINEPCDFTAIAYDASGRQLTSKKAVNTTKVRLKLSASTGIYVLSIIGKDHVINKKIFVK